MAPKLQTELELMPCMILDWLILISLESALLTKVREFAKKIHFTLVKIHFTLVNIHFTLVGIYEVRATNSLGEAMTTASLKVVSKGSLILDSQHPEGMRKITALESKVIIS